MLDQLTAHSEVASQRELRPTAQGVPIHRRHRRHRELFQQRHRAPQILHKLRGLLLGHRRPLFEIGAGAEHAWGGGPHHHAARAALLAEVDEALAQLPKELAPDGVSCLWAGEGQEKDAVVGGVERLQLGVEVGRFALGAAAGGGGVSVGGCPARAWRGYSAVLCLVQGFM